MLETCALFDELKINYGSLEEKLNEREEYFSKREFELQELHRCEISKGKRKFLVLDFREILIEVAEKLLLKQAEQSFSKLLISTSLQSNGTKY